MFNHRNAAVVTHHPEFPLTFPDKVHKYFIKFLKRLRRFLRTIKHVYQKLFFLKDLVHYEISFIVKMSRFFQYKRNKTTFN